MILSVIYLLVFLGVIAAIYNYLNNDEPPRIDEAEHKADLAAQLEAERLARRERAKARREKARAEKKK